MLPYFRFCSLPFFVFLITANPNYYSTSLIIFYFCFFRFLASFVFYP